MKVKDKGKSLMKIGLNFTFMIFILSFVLSCTEAENGQRVESAQTGVGSTDPGFTNPSGNGAAPGSGNNLNNSVTTEIVKVEIRHLIEPKVDSSSDGGEYKRKMTIPKNYNGLLYLAGINISTLSDKFIKVRFNFGPFSTPKDIDALVATAPGLTPQTNVEVLVMDLKSVPFQDIQLNYDLFDYNDYDYTGSSILPGVLSEPTLNNRNDKLYCRALALKDDNTFTGDLSSGCSASDDVCKYAYALVKDKTLVKQTTGQYYLPTERNIQTASSNYIDEDHDTKIARCLPDRPFGVTANAYQYDNSYAYLLFGSVVSLPVLGNYVYQGPYFASDLGNWEITENAIKGRFGLFGDVWDDNTNGSVDSSEYQYGFKSKLFPLYTKFDLLKDTQYTGSTIPNDPKVSLTMPSNGESAWMDGCNERVSTVDDTNGEHIGSCNVSATIEIIATDEEGNETRIDITDEVKIQLVKPAILNTAGDNVLHSSFESCSSSSQCGSGACCINKRCWSKSLVSQCVEDLPNYGNGITGGLCTSDYQCASLCCGSGGKCAPHDPGAGQPSYCSKPSGASCVSKEWCQKHPVTTCAIVFGPNDSQGGRTCEKRCIVTQVHGDCVSSSGSSVGQCRPPAFPDPNAVVFNPSDPNRCSDAITFAELEQQALSIK